MLSNSKELLDKIRELEVWIKATPDVDKKEKGLMLLSEATASLFGFKLDANTMLSVDYIGDIIPASRAAFDSKVGVKLSELTNVAIFTAVYMEAIEACRITVDELLEQAGVDGRLRCMVTISSLSTLYEDVARYCSRSNGINNVRRRDVS